MLSSHTVRRVCAAIDAFDVTCVAATITKSRTKSDLSAVPNECDTPENFPTIAACKAANLKPQAEPEASSSICSNPMLTNGLVVENSFAFEDTVSRLAGAGLFDLIERLLEHQKTLPQGFIVRIIMLYGKARMSDHALKTFHQMHLFWCPPTVKSFNATLEVFFPNLQI
ncbi:unnamed protein product [Musa acuminata subsp. burmannicoides]